MAWEPKVCRRVGNRVVLWEEVPGSPFKKGIQIRGIRPHEKMDDYLLTL